MGVTITKRELENYTREQVADCIRGALELVDELQPPAELRAAAFTEASRLLSSKQVVLEQAPSAIADLGMLRHQ